MPIAVIDFEIANANYNSACSVGIVVIDGLEVTKEEYSLIRPPGLVVDEAMSKIHGLTKRDLLSAPCFDVVWSKIKQYFNGDYIIAAHNAYFDVTVLHNTLSLVTEPVDVDFLYFDTIAYTSPVCKNVGTSLADRLEYFSISLDDAHNALADARATAELIIRTTQLTNLKSIEQYLVLNKIPTKEFKDLKVTTEFKKGKRSSQFASKKLDAVAPSTQYFDATHPLFDAQIAFTGDLDSMDRKKAAQAVTDLGGIVKSGVSRKTNFLVVGPQDPKLVGEKGVSTKEIKAAELIEKGFDIKILDETAFIALLHYKVPDEEVCLVESEAVLKERQPKSKKQAVEW